MILATHLPRDVADALDVLVRSLDQTCGRVNAVGIGGSVHTELYVTLHGAGWSRTYDWVRTREGSGFVERPYHKGIPQATLIAEVKEMSPFGYLAEESWTEQLVIARKYGDAVAIHTEAAYGGDLAKVQVAASACDQPIVAKGWHRKDHEIEDAFAAGATFALVVHRVPRRALRIRCLIEVATVEDLRKLPKGSFAVWNQRDLASGRPRTDETFQQAREAWSGWLCQASLIRTPIEVHNDADAVLIAQHLPEYTRRLRQ